MIRAEEQVFPTLNYRNAEEGLRIGIRGFPRSLYNNNYLKEKDNDKNYYDWTNRNDKGRT